MSITPWSVATADRGMSQGSRLISATSWNAYAAPTNFGEIHRRRAMEFEIGYRTVRSPREEWFVAAVLALKAGDPEQSQARIRELLGNRARTQPIQAPTAGSVFVNPTGDHAARLIETAGLKGTCVGGACVSEKHANFIVNTGGASAADIETLIEQIIDRVKDAHGVALRPEVRIVGDSKT